MNTILIPGTNLRVSVLGLGCGGMGTRVCGDDAYRILDLFVESGGTFLDTAHIYGAWVPGGAGASEKTLGAWLRARGARDRVVIGTKGGHPHLESMDVPRMSPADLRQDLEESLERLGLEHIDFYWLHRDEPARPMADIVETLAAFAAEGSIGAWGVSNWSVERIREALGYASDRGLPGPAGNQLGWNLASRSAGVGDPSMRFMDDRTHDFHSQTGMFVATYASQAGGFFTRGYTADTAPESVSPGHRAYLNAITFHRQEHAQELAARRGVTVNDVAVAYLLAQPFPVAALVGCGSEAHLRTSLTAARLQLTPADVQQLLAE